jgi:transcriptional regulator GlxA family with amidase domain
VLATLRRAIQRGQSSWVCSGAYVLGTADLLDGRDCTTHYQYVKDLGSRFLVARVNPDVLHIWDGPVLTTAGSVASLDLCLHLIRRDYGERVANVAAHGHATAPCRRQAQFVGHSARAQEAATLAPLLDEIAAELDSENCVASMPARAAMSERTFARRFRAQTGRRRTCR